MTIFWNDLFSPERTHLMSNCLNVTWLLQICMFILILEMIFTFQIICESLARIVSLRNFFLLVAILFSLIFLLNILFIIEHADHAINRLLSLWLFFRLNTFLILGCIWICIIEEVPSDPIYEIQISLLLDLIFLT